MRTVRKLRACASASARAARSPPPRSRRRRATASYRAKFFLGSCTFCNTCADFCVKHAIELTQDYHMVARCEDDLVVTGTYLKKKPVKKARPPPTARRLNRRRAPKPRETTACPSRPGQVRLLRSVPKKCPAGAPHRGPRTKTWTLDEDNASPAAPATTSAPRSALLCKPKSH